ncbi:hypothetical protein KFE94_14310 [bacterium SCSIO 12643]|nr:hypothetical protein KFE94_14310 [bacterium SCSIO 12643]
MKNLICSVALTVTVIFNLQSQSIKASDIKMGYSKEALKASKNSSLYNAGFFMSEDQTKLYKLSSFTDKKTNAEMLEVQTYNQNGEFIKVEVLPMTDESLSKYNIHRFEDNIEESRKNLNNLKVSYINNPTLAGKPNLVNGKLVPETNDLGVFLRYKFQKENSIELNEKFWAQVYYPIGDNVIDRNNYLIQPAPSKKLARAIFSCRNSFMPRENKAYIGGLMAVSGSKMFLSGIMDLKTNTWVSKHEIELPHPIYPGKRNYVKLNNDETGILIPSKDKFTYLHVSNTGAKKSIISLSIPKTGGQNGVQPSTFLLNEKNSVFCFATTAKGATGGDIGISVSKIDNGKESWSKSYTNEDLLNYAIQPLKEKVKINKFKMPFIQKVIKTDNGDLLVLIEAVKNTSNGTEKVFLMVHISTDGRLIASYPLPAVKPLSDEKLLSSLPVRIISNGDTFYAVIRSEVDGYQKGVYTDVTSSSYSSGGIKTTTTYTHSYRLDESQNAGYVIKINLAKKEASNVIQIDDFIVGNFPGTLSQDGHLFINTPKKIVVIK